MSHPIIPIFYACDDNFVKYTVVSLYSMIQNASKEYRYRVYVLHTGITEPMKKAVLDLKNENFEISFEDVSDYLQSISDKLPIRDYYSKTTYYRMFIAEMFQEYDKAETYITHAYQYAIKFDAKPNYSPLDIQFLVAEDIPTLLADGLGETAMEAIEHFVFEKAEPGEALEYIKNKFEVLKNEGITE